MGTSTWCARPPWLARAPFRSAGTCRHGGGAGSGRRCGRHRGGPRGGWPPAGLGAGGRAPLARASPSRGGATAVLAIGPRRRAGCPRRRSPTGSAGAPSAGPGPGRPVRGTRAARPRRRPGPTRLRSGSSTTRPRRRLSRSASEPPSAKWMTKRSQPCREPSPSTTMRPDIPRWSPSGGPESVSIHIALPRRWAETSVAPVRAASISPGACGRQTQVSPSSTSATVRPRACDSIRPRARSTSGSSGIEACTARPRPAPQASSGG